MSAEQELENQELRPTVFISYAWTSQTHMDWVMQLATDLKGQGVDVRIDRWHLREGQDAHSFMESLVRSDEVSKAILICDRKYVQRANDREGGVGVESQIITSEIYGDVGQTKFVAISVESDDNGEAVLPNFLKNRIFVDFRDKSLYSKRLQQLVRWAYDKPEYREPDLGPTPAFLNDQIDFEPLQIGHGLDIQKKEIASSNLQEFLKEAAVRRSDFTVSMSDDEPNDETVVAAIKSLPPIISQIRNEFDIVLSQRELSDSEIDATIEYLEAVFSHYGSGATQWSGDVTKFFGQFLLVLILSRCINYRRFESAQLLLGSSLLKMQDGGITAESVPIRQLNTYLKSLEARNQRLKLNRVSVHADLIHEICELAKINFADYMQADLIAYIVLYSEQEGRFWWPDSMIYATNAYGAFPWFVRALQPRFRDGLMRVLGIFNPDELDQLIAKIKDGSLPPLRWNSPFSTPDILRLANLLEIRKTYDA